MKVAELFEDKKLPPVDMMGKKHEGCGGTFKETSQHDDMNGTLHCTECNKETKRYVKAAKPVTEAKASKAIVKVTVRKHPTGVSQPTGTFTVKDIRQEKGADGPMVKICIDNSSGGWSIYPNKPPAFLSFTASDGRKISAAEAVKLFNDSKKPVKKMNESKDPLVSAIRDNWMSWPVSKIVKFLKERIKAGDKQWAYLKNASDIELEDRVDDAKDNAKNQYGEASDADFKYTEKRVKDFLAKGDDYSARQEVRGLDDKEQRKILNALIRKTMYAEVDESLNEGMYVVKSRDGVEKRFRDADSMEAKSWKTSLQKKPAKAEKYTHQWWADKEDADDDLVSPWAKIDGYRDTDALKDVVDEQGKSNVVDWSSRAGKNMEREGVPCATAVVRVMFHYTKDDDLGSDEDMEDSQSMIVARNPKKPTQLDFIKYTH